LCMLGKCSTTKLVFLKYVLIMQLKLALNSLYSPDWP
jgi:hypothetical protein